MKLLLHFINPISNRSGIKLDVRAEASNCTTSRFFSKDLEIVSAIKKRPNNGRSAECATLAKGTLSTSSEFL